MASPTLTDLQAEYYNNQDNQSIVGRGTATAPAAGAAILTLSPPPAGTYDVTVYARYGAVADVADNMDIRVAGTIFAVLPVLPIVNGAAIPINMKIKFDGIQNLYIRAPATGGAGSIFIVHVVATRTGNV